MTGKGHGHGIIIKDLKIITREKYTDTLEQSITCNYARLNRIGNAPRGRRGITQK